MSAINARYVAELPSIEAWLDWAYDHEPCTDARPRGPCLTALLQNLYVVTDALHWVPGWLAILVLAAVVVALGQRATRELRGARRELPDPNLESVPPCPENVARMYDNIWTNLKR